MELAKIMEVVSWVISCLAVMVLLWGVAVAAVRLVRLEFLRIKGQHMLKQRQLLRQQLGSYILLGLEFLIAADIIHTVIKQDLTLEDVGVLVGIVLIRTAISYFLHKEISDMRGPEWES